MFSKRQRLGSKLQGTWPSVYVSYVSKLRRPEMALHCRRSTRGVEETTKLIERLIESFAGVQGRDTLGVPLIDQRRMQAIWESQKKHVKCLQDTAGVAVYTQTGAMKIERNKFSLK
ncbi:hypothetical protein DPMN_122877 [Dreissena polymorpha]|uniref:Uncharacterized protein n=1 Tax=Dreissena polymorpha TaxID=45954 RepID=A0A9D4GWC6_DREPO|nr:hypothetical protein DPMN_122877 [Dreissena polymorpha]